MISKNNFNKKKGSNLHIFLVPPLRKKRDQNMPLPPLRFFHLKHFLVLIVSKN